MVAADLLDNTLSLTGPCAGAGAVDASRACTWWRQRVGMAARTTATKCSRPLGDGKADARARAGVKQKRAIGRRGLDGRAARVLWEG